MKILLAEDETDLREVVAAYLEYQGYTVVAVCNGQEALEKAKADAFDAMVLDVMMPVMDEAGNLSPAIFLTAKSQVSDRVEGLDAGADDYLTKPFAMEELSARLRALERRKRDYKARSLSFGNIELDTEASELRARNTISLAYKEVRLLECLITNSEREIPAAELLREIWAGEDADVDTVWMYVSFLQAKLQSVQANVVISGDRGHSYQLREI